MSRQVFWWSFGAACLVTLVAIWFLLNFDRIAYETRSEPQREALRNPYLAAERLLMQMGRRVETVQDAAVLDRLPPGGTLILSNERQFHLTPGRTAALIRWVEAGGYLLADGERVAASDPILRAFDVRLKPRISKPPPKTDDEETASREPVPGSEAKRLREPARQAVAIPGYGRTLRMRGNRARPLYVGGREPEWRVSAPPDRQNNVGAELLHFSVGRGQVTLLNGLRRFHNQSIAADDHAELLAALLTRYQPAGEVRIMTRLDVPSLWQWLGEHAQAALLSATALLAFWLWRIVPRFGAVRAEPQRERRSLVEHLRAMGVFLWRSRSTDVLLEAARGNVQARMALRHGELIAPPARESPVQLAQQTGIAADAIGFALTGRVHRPEQFTAAMATLRELEQKLR